jgi:hypothetical protein
MIALALVALTMTGIMASAAAIGAIWMLNAWGAADRTAAVFKTLPTWWSWPWYGHALYYRVLGAIMLAGAIAGWLVWMLGVMVPASSRL